MASQMPYFVRGEGINAANEFKEFAEAEAVHEPAAHLLAELVRIHNRGKLSDIPEADRDATNVRGLNCRHVGNWAVFYTAEGDESSCRVTVVHVGCLNPRSFNDLESEAERRLREL